MVFFYVKLYLDHHDLRGGGDSIRPEMLRNDVVGSNTMITNNED